jgi:hypothetical protein
MTQNTASGLTHKYSTRVVRSVREKHSRLIGPIVSFKDIFLNRPKYFFFRNSKSDDYPFKIHGNVNNILVRNQFNKTYEA